MNKKILVLLAAIISLGIVIIGSLIVFVLNVTRATPEPCITQSREYISSLEALLIKWDDTNKVANSTARIALSSPITQMQDIRRQVSELNPPDCAYYVQEYITSYMDTTIDAYLSFMADQPGVQRKMNDADQYLDKFTEEMINIRTR